MVCPSLYQDHRVYANELLTCFVANCEKLYGKGMLVYNVHMLLHLTSNVDNVGNLDECSAFPLEVYAST